MKRVFPRQSLAFALMLALSVSMSASGASQAALKDAWNPIHWFSGHSDADAAGIARQKAEMAQKEADLALQEAQHAKERADKARQAAEALNAHSAKHATKTVVTPPSPASADSAASSSEGDAQTASDNAAATAATSENTATDAAQAESGSSDAKAAIGTRADKSGDEASEPTQTNHLSEKSKAGTSWNPVNWFGGKSPKAASPKTTSAKAKASPNRDTAHGTTTDSDAARPDADNAKSPADSVAQNDTIAKTKVALVETEKGNIAFEFYPDQAPQTVANFVKLVNDGFYNKFNMRFHRVIPGFVIQTGDPTGTGAGGSKETIPLEAKNKLSHNGKGIVAMARGADPNSASSQFYITLAPQTSLDGKYAIFGRVISGFDVLDKIEKGDMLYGIRLVDGNSVARDPQPEKKKFFSSLF